MRRRPGSSKAPIIALLLTLAVVFPVGAYFFASQVLMITPAKQDKDQVDWSDPGRIDPGPAWLQTRPIMLPDGQNGYTILRAYLRMVDRDSADYVCRAHPRLAEEIQVILSQRPETVSGAVKGESGANRLVKRALEERVGASLFTRVIVSDTEQVMMADTDSARYECNRKQGLRLILRAK